MKGANRWVEEKVLKLVEELIDETSQASLVVGPMRDYHLEKARNTANQLILHCELLVNGNRSYVEPALRQLLQQKLPNPVVLKSFGEFSFVLDLVIEQSLLNFKQKEANQYIAQTDLSSLTKTAALDQDDNESNLETSVVQVGADENLIMVADIEEKPIHNLAAKIEATENNNIVGDLEPNVTRTKADTLGQDLSLVLERSLSQFLQGTRYYVERQETEKMFLVHCQIKKGNKAVPIAYTDTHSPDRIRRQLIRAGIVVGRTG